MQLHKHGQKPGFTLITSDLGDEGILQNLGLISTELNTLTWTRTWRRQRRIQGTKEQLQAQLLLPYHHPNLSRIFLVVHSTWKHIRK